MSHIFNLLPVYMVRSLGLTLAVECVAALLLGVRNKKDLLNVALVNILTNPIVVSVTYSVGFFYGFRRRMICLVFLEAFALITEAVIYKHTLSYKKLRPIVLSLILNASSYITGLIINNLL